MKADTSVKYFHSGMPGAPVLSGTAGATLAILDACLINGWGLKTVESLVVAGNEATANISTGHSAEAGTVVLIAGATPASLNGEWRVTVATANTVKFVTEGITDQTATGSVTLKIAPAGWAKPFTGANLAVYQPTDPTSSKMCLRVNDTGTTTCQVVGYESMSTVDTGVAPFPTVAQKVTGLWWQKSDVATTAARQWILCSDELLFYYGKGYFNSFQQLLDVGVFGEVASVKSVDPFACVLFGKADALVAQPTALTQLSWSDTTLAPLYVARSHTGIGGSIQLSRVAPTLAAMPTTSYPSGAAYGVPYPNPADGGLYLSPLNLLEGSAGSTPSALRGVFPGYYSCPHILPAGTFATGDPVVGVSSLPGRMLKVAQSFYTTPPNNQTAFLDVTGPWR